MKVIDKRKKNWTVMLNQHSIHLRYPLTILVLSPAIIPMSLDAFAFTAISMFLLCVIAMTGRMYYLESFTGDSHD